MSVCLFSVLTTTTRPRAPLHKIKSFYNHPKYNRDTGEFNLGLYKLEDELTFDKHTQPICFPLDDPLMTRNGSVATMMGWSWAIGEHAAYERIQQMSVRTMYTGGGGTEAERYAVITNSSAERNSSVSILVAGSNSLQLSQLNPFSSTHVPASYCRPLSPTTQPT